jgi:hypothetical protein
MKNKILIKNLIRVELQEEILPNEGKMPGLKNSNKSSLILIKI